MERFEQSSDQRAWSRAQRAAGEQIAFVPTMGALHEGHASLIRRARELADRVVVSIFVNPTQFDRAEDLEQYPASLADDLLVCQDLGVDAVFLPSAAHMYPSGYASFVEVAGAVNEHLCAVTRPGHFRGVCTVVLKLFHIVEPDIAVFGQKDLQQALIISRLIRDLDCAVSIEVAPTVRDADGLALSSRNRRLEPAQRAAALSLPEGLERANRAYLQGEHSAPALCGIVAEEVLQHEGTELDYVEVIDPSDFSEPEQVGRGHVLAAAIFVGAVRLIDHVALGVESLPVHLEH